jgi:hypothetical protein
LTSPAYKVFARRKFQNERWEMKFIVHALVFVASIIFTGVTHAQSEEETYLLCEGKIKNVMTGYESTEVKPLTLFKVDGKVKRVLKDGKAYTLEKVDIRRSEHKGPVYIQLIVDEDKLTLRMEVTETSQVADTVLYNSGSFKERRMFGAFSGRCAPSQKVF